MPSLNRLLKNGDQGANLLKDLPQGLKPRVDFAAFAAHLRSVLPKYAVPIFIRFVNDFQWTATHKIKKTDLKNDGFNPAATKGDLYALLPGSTKYTPVDDALYQDIMAGKYKF